MSTDPRERAFETCLNRLLAGDSLEDVLKLYPQWADDLRPMLKVAQAAASVGKDISVPRGGQARSRLKLLEKAHHRTRTRVSWFSFVPKRFSLAALILVVVLLFGSVSTVVVSAKALPGDTLYPVKLIAEKTRLLLANNPVSRVKLEHKFDQERVNEVSTLIERSQSQPVTFAGEVNRMDSDLWMVGGFPVQIGPGTNIRDEIQVGNYIGVHGTLQQNGVVIAIRVWNREFQVAGILESVSDERWTIDGVDIFVGRDANIGGDPVMGSQVTAWVAMMDNGDLYATRVDIVGLPLDVAATSPVLSPTATPSFTNSPLPVASPEQEATETLEPSETPDDDAQTPKPESTEEPDDTDEPTKTPKPTEDDDDEEKPTETPKPTEDDDDEEKPTKTPKPTEDDEHTPTPIPDATVTLTPTPDSSPSATPTATSTEEPAGEEPEETPDPIPTH